MGLAVECSSCGARFALSDALFEKKVSGRKVFIRCKTCGERIPVDASGGTRPEITWMVSYGETDDREMSSTEIAAALARGEIKTGTLVWAEGMPDWMPLAQVPELTALVPKEKEKPKPPPLRGKLPSQSGVTPASPAVIPAQKPEDAGAPAGLAAAAPGAEQAPVSGAATPAGPQRERLPSRSDGLAQEGTGGLFDAENARSIRPLPIEVTTGPAAAPRVRPQPDRSKVRRQSDAEILGLDSPPAATFAVPPIDLSKLAIAPPPPAEDVPRPGAPEAAPSAAKPVAGPPAPAAESAPAAADAGPKRGLLPWALPAIALVIVAIIVWRITRAHEPAGSEGAAAQVQQTAGAASPSTPETAAAAGDFTQPVASAEQQSAPAGREGGVGTKPLATAPGKPVGPSSSPPGGGKVAQAQSPSKPSAVTTSVGAGGAAFDRAAASAALAAAASSASACRKPGDPSGTATVVVTFAPSGRVTSANLSGPPFAGTATGGCIAASLRRVTVPPFSGDKVTVTKRVLIQ